MGLIARAKHRVAYVWWWRLRYWWLDTPSGAHARAWLFVVDGIAIAATLGWILRSKV